MYVHIKGVSETVFSLLDIHFESYLQRNFLESLRHSGSVCQIKYLSTS